MDLPQLERRYTHPQAAPDFDEEITAPEWKCHCCHDTGIMHDHWVKRLIPGYNSRDDLLVVCNACKASSNLSPAIDHMLDYRVSTEICRHFDKLSRDGWRETLNARAQRRREARAAIKQLSEAKSMRQIEEV